MKIMFMQQNAHLLYCSCYANHQYNAGHCSIKYCWNIVTKQHVLQQDSSSCGVYVMKVHIYINVACMHVYTYVRTV